jgi:hypothetical protein
MPTVAEELLRQLASRTAGRKPSWSLQTTVDPDNLPGPPQDTNVGIDVSKAIVTYLRIVQRLDPARRYAEVKIEEVDDTTTYTVTVNGTDNDYVPDPGDGEDEIYAGMADAINTGGEAANVTATVLATDEGRFFPGKVMKVVQDIAGTGFDSIATGTVGGTGELDDKIESSACAIRVHGLSSELEDVVTSIDHSLQCFDIIDGLENYSTIEGRNKIIRIDSASLAKIFMEPLSANGVVELLVGPATLETDADSTVTA